MNPEQAPSSQQVTPQQPVAAGKMQKRTKAALWLMIGPTALLIGSFVLFAIANLAFASVTPTPAPAPDQLFGQSSAFETTTNVLMFLIGFIGFATWLPGLIIGIVLLATRK